MTFSSLSVGQTFLLGKSEEVYRKVSPAFYTYHADTKDIWKYWAPGYWKVSLAGSIGSR